MEQRTKIPIKFRLGEFNHIEKLAEEKQLSVADIKKLIKLTNCDKTAIKDVTKAITKHGVEKLKPLYGETEEKYNYEIIRLIRVLYLLD